MNNNWILLGNEDLSEKLWGINKIEFPCGYLIHEGAYTNDNNLITDGFENNYLCLGGLAFESNKIDKGAKVNERSIKNIRPWMGVYNNKLLKELKDRKHTITMWDEGISIFHSFWNERCQIYGDPINENTLINQIVLSCEENEEIGLDYRHYLNKPIDVLKFMSEFQTIKDGDKFILGPLCSINLSKKNKNVNFTMGELLLKCNIL